MSKVVLVTGGAGYIGSHTCKALANAGYLPVALDNLVYGHDWAVKWGPLVQADLRDATALNATFETYRPIAVLHFAAYAYVGESMAAPEKYYRNNVAGTLSLLEAMLRYRCRHFVFSSTCATYGNPATTPITEEQEQRPINPYGWSKLMVEQILRDYARAHGLRFFALRYFNAAGADPQGEIGEDHSPETHLIPLAVEAVLGRRECLDIYGTDYPTPDGSAVRDYVHVTDLADAHVHALARLLTDCPSAFLNVGTGQGHSVRDVLKAVERAAGKSVPIKYAPRRPGDPPILVADPQRSVKLLEWQPRFVGLDSIVSTAFRWHQLHDSRRLGSNES